MSVEEVLAMCLREARGIHVGDRRTASFALFEKLNVLMLRARGVFARRGRTRLEFRHLRSHFDQSRDPRQNKTRTKKSTR
jgi:hypothetical protein